MILSDIISTKNSTSPGSPDRILTNNNYNYYNSYFNYVKIGKKFLDLFWLFLKLKDFKFLNP